jgi:vacuolar-type H+-ATPase subunit E/Vma4
MAKIARPYYDNRGKGKELIELLQKRNKLEEIIKSINHSLRSATGQDRQELLNNKEQIVEQLEQARKEVENFR